MTTYFNKPWLDFTGRALEQELGLGSRDSIHPDDLPRFVAVYEAARSAQRPFQTDYRLRRARRRVPLGPRDGDAPLHGLGRVRGLHRLRDRHLRAPAGRGRGARERGAVPIHGRRRARHDLARRRERPLHLLQQALARLHRAPAPGRSSGSAGWTGVHADDLARILQIERAARTARQPFSMEYRLRRHDGEYRWIFDTGAPALHARGRLRRATSARRSTSPTAAGPRRPWSRARPAIASRSSTPPRRSSSSTSTRGRFVEANDNAVRLYGLPREALLATGPAALSPPIQPDGRPSAIGVREKHPGGRSTASTPVFEWIHRDAAGRDVPCEVRLVRLPSATRRLVRGSVTDISQRKRLREGAVRALLASPRRRARPRTSTSSTPRSTRIVGRADVRPELLRRAARPRLGDALVPVLRGRGRPAARRRARCATA